MIPSWQGAVFIGGTALCAFLVYGFFRLIRHIRQYPHCDGWDEP
jgi:hypothetical protein